MEYIAYEGDEMTIEWYYNTKGKSNALEYFETLSESAQNKLFYLLKRLGDFGKISDITKFRYEGDSLYVFKPQPWRFFCFFANGKKVIITHGFLKKGFKMPKKEKLRARQCRKDYVSRVSTGDYYETE